MCAAAILGGNQYLLLWRMSTWAACAISCCSTLLIWLSQTPYFEDDIPIALLWCCAVLLSSDINRDDIDLNIFPE